MSESGKQHHALVIMCRKHLEDEWRYFCKFKNGRLITAWSLVGAKLFLPHEDSFIRIEAIIKSMKERTWKHIKVTRVSLLFDYGEFTTPLKNAKI